MHKKALNYIQYFHHTNHLTLTLEHYIHVSFIYPLFENVALQPHQIVLFSINSSPIRAIILRHESKLDRHEHLQLLL